MWLKGARSKLLHATASCKDGVVTFSKPIASSEIIVDSRSEMTGKGGHTN